jgi:hypothetical protein
MKDSFDVPQSPGGCRPAPLAPASARAGGQSSSLSAKPTGAAPGFARNSSPMKDFIGLSVDCP